MDDKACKGEESPTERFCQFDGEARKRELNETEEKASASPPHLHSLDLSFFLSVNIFSFFDKKEG